MSLDDRRRLLAQAEARVELERAALRQQRHANERAMHDLKPWATVLGGIVAGWWLGRLRAPRRPVDPGRRPSPFARRAAPSLHGDAAQPPPAPRRPTLLGLASLALAGSRAVPIVLPLALSWLDRRYGAPSAGRDAPAPMPMWVIALRGLAPLLRR